MKKLLITLLVLLLLGGLIFGLLYFFWTAENFALLGQNAMNDKNYSRALRFYEIAFDLDPENSEYAQALSDACIAEENFTKAERYLVNAIRVAPSAELYCKLAAVYVAQDKLMDAQEMLDNISDPGIAAQIEGMRPVAPTFSYESGEYEEYISVSLSAQEGSIYYSLDAEYPSLSNDPYSDTIPMVTGENHITAIVVTDNGLVSSLASADYLIRGVVEDVTFASAELESYVREVLYLPRTEPITTEDLWGFTELTLPSDVTDYSDLRHFINLTSLTIQESTVEDYAFLAFTPDLSFLDLFDSNISQETMELIGTLSKLETLNLSSCGLSNISSLSGNTALVCLNLSDNSISDLSSLAGMTGLTELNLSGNAITSLDGLQKLRSLVTLDISENNITDLAPLQDCTKLEMFHADGNQISSLDILSAMPKLSTLTVSRNKIADITSLSSCTELNHLEVAENVLTAIDVIATLDKLTYLDASHNTITALPSLKDTVPLQQINISHNQIEDISTLSGLISLYYVNVEYNPNLVDIECLANCHFLARVDAFGTKVKEVKKLLDMGISVNYDPSIAIEENN